MFFAHFRQTRASLGTDLAQNKAHDLALVSHEHFMQLGERFRWANKLLRKTKGVSRFYNVPKCSKRSRYL